MLKRSFVTSAILLGTTLLLSACVSTRARHGFVAEANEAELEAQVGIDSKDSVLARYGEPSIRPTLDEEAWYYVTFTTNARAFYRTRTTNRNVVAFRFDENDMVKAVDRFELKDGIPVNLVDRETPSRGKELSILEQLLGTVGQLPITEEQGPGQ
ncbi:MAG: outer membrane protein assembly factor BamE domain-containing protein [bacterium]